MVTYFESIESLWHGYKTNTPQRLKIIDMYLVYVLVTGISLFAYCAIVRTTFPFNSFLAGFVSTVGSFVLAVALRVQVNPAHNELKWRDLSVQRSFADFLLCSIILHLVVFNFMG
jgi:oligosaccharyltransferase complex subunit epsilon